MNATATDVKNNFGKFLKLLKYEEVIITKNGKSIAKLIPVEEDYPYEVSEETVNYAIEDLKVSYEEFLKLTAASEKRYELIDGEVYMLSSPSTIHQRIVGELFGHFYNFFKNKKCTPLTSPYDITLKKSSKNINVVQPDIVVVCDLDENNDENDRYIGIPTLVVEIISKSSKSRDLVKKLDLYMLSGVKEYWIIDPYLKETYLYSFSDYELENYSSLKFNDTIQSNIFKDLNIHMNALFI
jgi:prevent-host-death family protein